MKAIEQGFTKELGPHSLSVPNDVRTGAELKRYEDGLDAPISAWVKVRYLKEAAVPLGDHTAAIWCPSEVVGYAR